MNAIIFSKDRAMQCDALIRSIKCNCNVFNKIDVLYKTQYEGSYINLKKKHSDVVFTCEEDFKEDLMRLIEDADDYCALFVDDCIVYRKVEPWVLYESIMDGVDVISLRLGDNIEIKKHFSYKGSIDGNIFKKSLLLRLWDETFNNPNKLEIRLCRIAKNDVMAWMARPYLVGIPANKVSDTSGCYDMGVSVEDLDNMWREGYEIDFEAMDFSKLSNVHENIEYAYKLG